MPRDLQIPIFVGIKDSVIALDDRTSTEVRRTELRSSDYVNAYFDGEMLIVADSGEVWRLDSANGSVIWHSELKGPWRGLVSLATTRRPGGSTSGDAAAEKVRRDAAAAASASR